MDLEHGADSTRLFVGKWATLRKREMVVDCRIEVAESPVLYMSAMSSSQRLWSSSVTSVVV